LRSLVAQFDFEKLTYFLRFVCVPQVMDVSTAFSSSRELDEERTSVCQLLAEIDSANLDEYQTEIKNPGKPNKSGGIKTEKTCHPNPESQLSANSISNHHSNLPKIIRQPRTPKSILTANDFPT